MKKLSLPVSIVALIITCLSTGCEKNTLEELQNRVAYTMPSEEVEHTGTWLTWPHDHGYEPLISRYEPIWVEMVKGLHTGEKVFIIAYDETEQTRIETKLEQEGIDLNQVEFVVRKTDDVWIRDNGPIFCFDNSGDPVVQNWQFNGWGGKADYALSNQVHL